MNKSVLLWLVLVLCTACGGHSERLSDDENLLFDFAIKDIAKICVVDDSRGYIHYAAKDSLPPMYISNFQQVYFDKNISVCGDSLIPYGSVLFWLSTGDVLDYRFYRKQNDIFRCYTVIDNKDTVIMPFQAIDRILAVDRYN